MGPLSDLFEHAYVCAMADVPRKRAAVPARCIVPNAVLSWCSSRRCGLRIGEQEAKPHDVCVVPDGFSAMTALLKGFV